MPRAGDPRDELLSGEDLRRRIRRAGPIAVEEVLRLIEQAAIALDRDPDVVNGHDAWVGDLRGEARLEPQLGDALGARGRRSAACASAVDLERDLALGSPSAAKD